MTRRVIEPPTPSASVQGTPIPELPDSRPSLVGTTERVAVVGAMAVAALLITAAFGRARVQHSETYFVPFWIGMLLAYSTAGWVLLRRPTALLPLVYLAGITALPKLLMSTGGPIYFDEVAHFQLLRETLHHGALFQYTPLLPIGTHFPGLEACAAAIALISGLSPWHAAELLVILAHLLVPLLVLLAARAVPALRSFAGIAALVYMANPSYIYFDMQFAYESLALVFVFGAICCAMWGLRESSTRGRAGMVATAVLLTLACIVTHHLSALALVGLLWVLALFDRPTAESGEVMSDPGHVVRYAPAVASVLGITLWFGLVAPGTLGYLFPYLSMAVSAIVHGHGRALFGKADIPTYELFCGVLAPFVLAVFGAIAGEAWLRRREIRRSLSWLYVIGLAYFLAVPLTITAGGAAGAHRAWVTSFFGVAMIVAFGLALCRPHLIRRSVKLLLWVALAVVLIGDTAQSVGVDYRFPGPYQYGSDTRSADAESAALAAWVRDQLGPGRGIITDRFTSLALVNGANSMTPQAYRSLPISSFWYSSGPPSRALMRALQAGRDYYLVVDMRSTYYRAVEAPLFGNGKSGLVPSASLERLRFYPWLHELYESTNFELFKINYAQYYKWMG